MDDAITSVEWLEERITKRDTVVITLLRYLEQNLNILVTQRITSQSIEYSTASVTILDCDHDKSVQFCLFLKK